MASLESKGIAHRHIITLPGLISKISEEVATETVASCPWGPGAPKYFEKMKFILV